MSKDSSNRLTANLALLAEIRRTTPSATHVYIRRYKKGIDIGWVDIPIGQAEMTLRNNPSWELLSSNKQMDDVVEKLFADEPEDPIDVPPKPSEMVPPPVIIDLATHVMDTLNSPDLADLGSAPLVPPTVTPAPRKRTAKHATRARNK